MVHPQRTPTKPLKILITGVSGFVAGCVAEAAKRRGHHVMGVSHPWAQKIGQILESEQPDVIFHGAGSASVAASIDHPEKDRAMSVGTWECLLRATTDSGLRPLVLFPSSAAVYGNPECLPVPESSPLNPISPYGRHKVECEKLAEAYRIHHNLPVVVFRLFSLHGCRQKRLLVRELFEQASSENAEILLAGTGSESRDYLGDDDFGEAVLYFAEKFHGLPPADVDPWIFNLASGIETQVSKVAATIAAELACNKPIRCRNQTRAGDPARWVADISAFRRACPDWSPLPFAESLKQTLAAWKTETP